MRWHSFPIQNTLMDSIHELCYFHCRLNRLLIKSTWTGSTNTLQSFLRWLGQHHFLMAASIHGEGLKELECRQVEDWMMYHLLVLQILKRKQLPD